LTKFHLLVQPEGEEKRKKREERHNGTKGGSGYEWDPFRIRKKLWRRTKVQRDRGKGYGKGTKVDGIAGPNSVNHGLLPVNREKSCRPVTVEGDLRQARGRVPIKREDSNESVLLARFFQGGFPKRNGAQKKMAKVWVNESHPRSVFKKS